MEEGKTGKANSAGVDQGTRLYCPVKGRELEPFFTKTKTSAWKHRKSWETASGFKQNQVLSLLSSPRDLRCQVTHSCVTF